MVANPMQKMKRTSTLVGVVIGLMVGLILCGAMYVVFIQPTMGTGITNKGEMVDVAILNKTIKSGAEITAADVTQSKVSSQNAPTDATLNVVGSVAKIDLTAGTILSTNMLTTSDSKETQDLRVQEYNMITLPTQLTTGSFIDIRLQLPDGGDYIVISKKCVQNANATTVWLKMNEEEILTMSNAIVEHYIVSGSKLYATVYTSPGTQKAATPTYCPNATVVDIINSELNGNITEITEGRYTDKLKNIRNSRIKPQVEKYSDTSLENLETKIQEEIKNLKEARQSYFGALNSAQK